MYRLIVLAHVLILVLVGGTSCSPVECVPGYVRVCPCLGGGEGVQSCNTAGTAFDSCLCGDAGLDGGVDDGGADGGFDGAGGDGSAEVGTDTGEEGELPGSLCEPCEYSEECGGQTDYCLLNNTTSETFCGLDCSATECPERFECYPVWNWSTIVYQCVPESETCNDEPPPPCDPPCQVGQVCQGGVCVDPGSWESELVHCVDVLNSYRMQYGLSPLARSSSLEDCAMEGAESDGLSGIPHGHFQATSGCNYLADAENEIPGWPLSWFGTVEDIIELGTASMMDEGPGGGHHDNILGDHTMVGCGIYVTSANDVWVVQDFR